MMMSIGAIALVLALGQPPQETACWAHQRPNNLKVTRTLPRGYTLTIGPAADPDDIESGCLVEVRNAAGKLVFEGAGFNTRLHPESGRDVDGDGQPDVIVGVDSGGGNRCCWEYNVISLSPRVRVIARFANPGFVSDGSGRTVIRTTVPFYDLGPSMAQSPTLEIAEQFRSGRLVDITSEYCGSILAGTVRGQGDLSAELASLEGTRKADSKLASARPGFDIETTRVSAITVALQLVYCDRPAEASRLIQEVWPDSMQREVSKSVEAGVAGARARSRQPR